MSLRLLNGLLVMLVRMSYTSSEVTQTYSMCSTARLLDMNGTNMQQNWSNSSKEKTNNQEESWFPTPVIDCHSLPRGYRPSPRLRRLTQGRAFFLRVSSALRVFPGALRFSWRFFCPGGSLFLAILLSWRFAFPGDSRVLAIPVSWRFPTRPGGPWFGRTSTSTQSRFLVAFGAPAPSSSSMQSKLQKLTLRTQSLRARARPWAFGKRKDLSSPEKSNLRYLSFKLP